MSFGGSVNDAQPYAQAGLRKSAQPLSFTLGVGWFGALFGFVASLNVVATANTAALPDHRCFCQAVIVGGEPISTRFFGQVVFLGGCLSAAALSAVTAKRDGFGKLFCPWWLYVSGSRTRLPAPSPLRTVHGSFDPHGSSLSKASFDTRFRNFCKAFMILIFSLLT
jgi:hypothetical protein